MAKPHNKEGSSSSNDFLKYYQYSEKTFLLIFYSKVSLMIVL